jgi:hypothetical protein
MCNLYSITTNQAAIIALFRVVNRYVGTSRRCRACFRIIRRCPKHGRRDGALAERQRSVKKL